MKIGAAYLASIAACLAVTTTPALAEPSSAPRADWTKRVTLSNMGGHVLGNPLAKHKLVEYVSYTCNHCANFEIQSHAPLKSAYITKGHISAEVRNFVRDPVDLTAALLARCGGRTSFLGNHHALMSAQSDWLATVQSTSPETQKGWYQGEFADRLKNIASDAGFYDLMKKRGYSKAQSNACLTNKDAQNKILAMTKQATQTLKLTGTPSFTVNGNVLKNVHSWPVLQQKLNGLPQ